MKVNSITNTNFKGLFTDRTKENGGNWRMEYRPYSWEGKMAPKSQVDVFSSKLPMNEEIYIDTPNYKLSKDILDTVSYINDTRNGKDILRRTITEMPSLSYEESLRVQDKKLQAFLTMKEEVMQELKRPLENRKTYLFNAAQNHDIYVSDFERSWGSHRFEKEERIKGLRQNFDKMTRHADELGNNFEKYALLSDSSNSVRRQREKIREELEKIELAKSKNSFVDISRRDIDKPFEQLVQAFKNFEQAKSKLFALSNRTITGSEIMEGTGKDFNIQKAVNYVTSLMRKKI